ncbi:MAG: hypothetical protein ACODAU_13605 [Myxococcota bacterium]
MRATHSALASALVAAAVLSPPALAAVARAQSSEDIREYAETIVEMTTPRWEGQVVDWPEPRPRPAGSTHVLESPRWPVAVHAGAEVPVRRARRALSALETAHDLLDAAGWPAPWPDGGRGGTGGFDLYLAPLDDGGGAEAFSDGAVPWSFYDAVSSYAVVDPAVARGALDACVASAYVQAALLGQDPAEAAAWRRATGAYVAWLLTGEAGCTGGVAAQQEQPWRSWIGRAEPGRDASGGALLLALLSARHDGGTGVFVRELWQLARQRSAPLDGLRGSPDLWQALEADLEAGESDLDDTITSLAVTRRFSGDRARGHVNGPLRALLEGTAVPTWLRAAWEDLPEHSPPSEPPLEPYGSAYAVVDVSEAPPGAVLRIWLRGEYGVRWSLVAVRLDAAGRELHRVTAPPRKVPRSYVPLELDGDTERVLIVATNLSSRLPDADIRDENVRTFRLILDRGGQPSAGSDQPSADR